MVVREREKERKRRRDIGGIKREGEGDKRGERVLRSAVLGKQQFERVPHEF